MAQTDRITLTGLRVRGHHGVLVAERRDGQEFVIDVVLEVDLAPAAATDDLTRTVHYGELAEQLAAVVVGPPVDLIETLAERLAAACLAYEPVRSATVTVHKPHAPIDVTFADVAVTVVRTRDVTSAELVERDGRLVVAATDATIDDDAVQALRDDAQR